MYFDQNGWRDFFKGLHYLWKHDGNPRRPHVELTTGGYHSDGFFNWSVVAKSDWLVTKVARDLLELIQLAEVSINEIEQIIGHGSGAKSLIKNLGRQIQRPHAVASKVTGSTVGEFCFDDGLPQINKNALLIDDTISTATSVLQVAKRAEALGAKSLPIIGAVCNRSGQSEIKGYRIVALVNEPMARFAPDECPLCKVGSVAIRAKANWDKLDRDYPVV